MLATTVRVLAQIRHDPRTIALLLVVPSVLLFLLQQRRRATAAELADALAVHFSHLYRNAYVLSYLLAAAAVLIALATVSWQSVKAALANPVEALRSE
jgi:hypothetical protein